MEDAKARLGKFLAKERAMREQQSSSKKTELTKPTPSSTRNTDSSVPDISSPDTFDDTKRRLSRLKTSPLRTAMSIRREREAQSAPNSPARSLRRSYEVSSDDTPRRVTKRLTLKSPTSALSDKSSSNKPQKVRVTRSLSPLPTKPILSSSAVSRSSLDSSAKKRRSLSHHETLFADEDRSLISVPFPAVGLDVSRNERERSSQSLFSSGADLYAPKSDPLVDSKLCNHVIDEILHWEGGIASISSEAELWKRLNIAATSLKRLGVEKILCFRRKPHDNAYSRRGLDERDVDHEIAAPSIDHLFIGSKHFEKESFLKIGSQDSRFHTLCKHFRLHVDFETKVLEESSGELNYLLLGVKQNDQRPDEIDTIVAFHVNEHSMRVPFQFLAGKQGEALRAMLCSTTRMLAVHVWTAVLKGLKRLHELEEGELLAARKADMAQESVSNEALLAFSIWANSTELELNLLAMSLLKSVSVFQSNSNVNERNNAVSGPSWVVFFSKSRSSSAMEGFTVGRARCSSSPSIAGDSPTQLIFEFLPMSHPALSLLQPEQYSQTQIVSVSDSSQLRWLHSSVDHVGSAARSFVRMQFSADSQGRRLHCVVLSPILPNVKKTLLINHVRDLGLLAQPALSSALQHVETRSTMGFAQAASLLWGRDLDPSPSVISPAMNRESQESVAQLLSLIDCIESNQFASSVGVRRAVVLLDSKLSFSVGAAREIASNECAFFVRNTSGRENRGMLTPLRFHADTDAAWWSDLQSGKIVLFNLNDSMRRDFPLALHAQRIDKMDIDHSQSGKVTVSAQLDLYKFLASVDGEAQSMMLMPLNIPGKGTAMLMLIDKLEDWSSIGWTPALSPTQHQLKSKEDMSVFDAQYCEKLGRVYAVPLLRKHLLLCTEQRVLSSHISEMSLEHRELEHENSLLVAVIRRQSQQRLIAKSFIHWRLSANQKKLQDQLKNKEFVVDCLLSLVTFRQQLRSTNKGSNLIPLTAKAMQDSYFRLFESWLRRLFPNDSVSVSSVASSASAPDLELPDTISIVDQIVDCSAALMESDPANQRPSPAPRVVANVSISRPSMNGKFSYEDAKWLGDLCQLASDIWSALTLGFLKDGADGDVRSLAIPMLQSVVVPMLDVFRSDESVESLEVVVQQLSLWIKKICGADLVVMNLRNDALVSSGSSSSVPLRHSKNNESLVFSTEASDRLDDNVSRAMRDLQRVVSFETSHMEPADRATVSTANVREPSLRHGGMSAALPSMGEIKLVMPSGTTLNEEHRRFTEIMLFLLAHVVAVKKELTKKLRDADATKEEIKRITENVSTVKNELQSLQLQNQYLSFETSFWIQCIRFGEALVSHEWSSMRDLSQFISQQMPQVLRCDSVLFSIDCGHERLSGESKIMSESFILYNGPLEAHRGDANTSEEEDIIPLRQLLQLPKFFDTCSSTAVDVVPRQSVIPLVSSRATKTIFACLIAQYEEGSSSKRRKTLELVEETSEIFAQFLNDVVFAAVTTVNRAVRLSEMRAQVQGLAADVEQKQVELAHLSDLKNTLQEKKGQIQELQEAQELLQTKLSHAAQEHESLSRELEAKLQSQIEILAGTKRELSDHAQEVERRLEDTENELQSERDCKAALLDVSCKFAYDPRCQRECVILWLRDIAHSRQSNLTALSPSQQGFPTLGSENRSSAAENIVGIWSAVGEATRTGKAVCFVSQTSPPEIALNSSSIRTRGIMRNTNEDAGESVEVLCIPNRASRGNGFAKNSPASSPSAAVQISPEDSCFVFVKPKFEKWHTGFSEEDKLVLEAAVNMSSRLLLKIPSEVEAEDFFAIENQLQSSNRVTEKLISCISTIRDSFLMTEIKSSKDVVKLVQHCVTTSLRDSARSFVDVDCFVVLTDSLSSKKMKLLNPQAQQLIQDVRQRGVTVCQGNMTAIPFGSVKKAMDGIILVEKKIRASTTAVAAQEVSVEQLAIDKLDEHILDIIATFAIFIVDKINSVKEAFQSIQEAGSAITVIQETKEKIEEKLAVEISNKLEFEEALKMSADMLSLACSQRTAVGQLVDLLRKQALTLTSSQDAFVILPYAAEHVLSDILAEQGDADVLLRSLNTGGSDFYTLLPDNPAPCATRFEVGDMELQSIMGFRSILHDSVSQGHSSGWRCWVVRRIDATRRLGSTLESALTSEHSDLCVMAVPFYLRSNTADTLSHAATSRANATEEALEPALSLQGKVGLVVVVRSSASYTETDKECVSWLAKSFSFCLATRGGELNAKQNLTHIRSLQQQLQSLQMIESRYDNLFSDVNRISKALKFDSLGENALFGTLRSPSGARSWSESLSAYACSAGNMAREEVDRLEEEVFLSILAQQVFTLHRGARGSALEENALQMEETNERVWSDFYVASLWPEPSDRESVSARSGEDAFTRQGSIAQSMKYTLKLGFLSLKEKNATPMNADLVFALPDSRIKCAICRLEQTNESPRYFLFLRRSSSTALSEDERERSQADGSASSIGFNLMNLDLKLRLAETLCSQFCAWKRSSVQMAQALNRMQMDGKDREAVMQEEREQARKELAVLEQRFEHALQTEREKSSAQLQRKTKHQRQLEAIEKACGAISTFIFSLPQAQCSFLGDLVGAIAEAAEYDFALGHFSVTDERPLVTSNEQSCDGIDWLRNERHLSFPVVDASEKNKRTVWSSFPTSLPSSADLRGFRITVFVNPERDLDADAPSSPSARFKQELQAFHEQCAVLGEKFAFQMEIVVMTADDTTLFLDNSENEDDEAVAESKDRDVDKPSQRMQRNLAAGSGKSRQSVRVTAGTLLLESSIFADRPQSQSGKATTVTVAAMQPRCAFVLLAPQSAQTTVSKSVLQSLVRAMHQLALSSVVKTFQDKHLHQLITHRRLHGVSKLQCLRKELLLREYRQRSSLFVWQARFLIPKLQAEIADSHAKFHASREKASLLEQRSADWTEMVKALGGVAATATMGGVASLWARANHSLLSVLSSRCAVTDCALIIDRDHGEDRGEKKKGPVELLVRSLSTPAAPRMHKTTRPQLVAQRDSVDLLQGSSEDDISADEVAQCVEYAKTSLERRAVSELGHRLSRQLLEIFGAGASSSSVHSVQRLYRVTDGREREGERGSLTTYLVPVRTAHKVVAAVRVAVEALPVSLARPTEQESGSVSAIEHSLVAFADLLAPIILAAQAFEADRVRLRDLREKIARRDSQLQSVSQQCRMNESAHTKLCEVTQKITRVFAESCLRSAEALKPEQTQLDKLLEQCCSTTSTILSEVFDTNVDIVIDSPFQKNDVSEEVGERNPRLSASKALSFALSRPPQRGTSLPSTEREREDGSFTVVKEFICATNGRRIGELSMDLPRESVDSAEMRQTLRSIASCIALCCAQMQERHLSAQSMREKDSQNALLQELHANEVEQRRTLEDECSSAVRALGIQTKWSKLSNECLRHVTLCDLERIPANYSLTQALASESTQSLLIFLRELVDSTLSLLGRHQFGINVAVLDGETDDTGARKLLWVYGDSSIASSTDKTVPALQWDALSPSTRAIALNMTNLCISSRQRTAIDVRQGRSTIQVLAMPLSFAYSTTKDGEIVGALQILCRGSEDHIIGDLDPLDLDESTGTNEHIGPHGMNEDILQDLTSLLSRLLSFEIVQSVRSQSSLALEASLVTLQIKAQEEEQQHTHCERLCKYWRAVSAVLRALQHSLEQLQEGSIDIFDFLHFESIRSHLHELGMIVRWRMNTAKDTAGERDSVILQQEQSPEGALRVIAKTVIPVWSSSAKTSMHSAPPGCEEVSNSQIEIILLDAQPLSSSDTHKAELLSHAYEFVAIVSEAVQVVLSQYRRSFGLVAESNQNVDSVKQELQRYKAKATKYSQELEVQRNAIVAKQEETNKLLEDSRKFQSEVVRLAQTPKNFIPVDMRRGLNELVRRLLSTNHEKAAASESCASFCRQAMKLSTHCVDEWARTVLNVRDMPRHISLLVRKERWRALEGGLVSGDTDGITESKRKSSSSEETKHYKIAELLPLMLFDASHSGSEIILMRQSRLSREQKDRSNRTNGSGSITQSMLERCFFEGQQLLQGDDLGELPITDLLGIEDVVFQSSGDAQRYRFFIQCVGIKFTDNMSESGEESDCDAVLRWVIAQPVSSLSKESKSKKAVSISEVVNTTNAIFDKKSLHRIETALSTSMLSSSPLLQYLAIFLSTSLTAYFRTKIVTRAAESVSNVGMEQKQLLDMTRSQLSRYKKLQKVVLRECCALLDAPLVGVSGGAVRAIHPASLTPLAASQDTCMKILALLRSLLRTEGQALLLKDITTVPHTYQLIYSGDALSWPGVEQNVFGVVNSQQTNNSSDLRISLVETAVSSRKTINVTNAPADERYLSQIDGICSVGTPMIVVPMRGRAGAVVGVLVGARGGNSAEFSAEDSCAAEMVASMGALSLYWCQGLGSLHHTLHKTIQKMDKLEKAMNKTSTLKLN